MNTPGLKTRSLNAAAWSIGGQILKTALAFAIFAVLARLLSPEDYGMLGMVMVLVYFARVFTDSGFNIALVQAQDLEEVHYSSVFWLNLAAGLVLTLGFLFAAPAIAAFYGRPELEPLTRVLSFTFLVWAIGLIQTTLLVKELAFARLTLIELAAHALGGITAVVMALAGCGVWSIVIQALLVPLLTSALLWMHSSWRPAAVFHWPAIRQLSGFSLNLLGNNVLNYWARNIDYLLIGKFLGAVPLGFYNRAYSVMMLPITNLSQAISRALFPSLSRIQSDPARVKAVFLRVARVVAFLAYPAILGLIAIAPHFIELVIGEKWMPMVPVLRILCIVSLIQCTSSLIGNLYMSQGRTDLQFRVTFWLRLNLIAGIAIGLNWGIEGVATGYLIAVLVNQIPNFHYGGALVGLRYREYVATNAATLACAAFMALSVFGLSMILDQRVPLWLAVVAEILSGIVIYAMLVWLLGVRAARETFEAVRDVLPVLPGRWNRLTGARASR
jgi:PST family polysaccharide transporter